MSDKSNYTDVLLEDINSKFDAVLEVVGGLQTNVNKIPKMAERIEKLENILEDVTDLQKRVQTLETV